MAEHEQPLGRTKVDTSFKEFVKAALKRYPQAPTLIEEAAHEVLLEQMRDDQAS